MNWITIPLHKVARLESGFGFPREFQGDENQEFPFFRVSDMNIHGNEIFMVNHTNTVSATVLEELGARVFPHGTVIFPKIGAAIATEKKRILVRPATYDNNVMGAVPKECVNPKFLYYWFSQLKLTEYANPGHVPSIRKSVMEEIPFPVITSLEQSRIVEVLDEADRLRKLRRETDAKAARILPSLYLKMFGDPATNPKQLRKKPLGELIKVKSGNFLPAKDMAAEGTFPVYGGNGVSGYHDSFMFEERKVVLGRVGAYCGAVHYSLPNSWITDNALYVYEKLEFLDDYYLVAALEQTNLNQYAGRAGQPLISGSRIYPVEILVPPENLQIEFSQSVSKLLVIDEIRVSASARLDQLWELLINRAFSGQLTAKWREDHMKELLAEMEQQARALNLPSSIEGRV